MTTNNIIQEHNKKHVEEDSRKRSVSMMEEVKGDSSYSESRKLVCVRTEPEQIPDWGTFFAGNNIVSDFMKHHSVGNGKKYLTALQVADRQDPASVSDIDSETNLLLASLLMRISRSERELLSKVMAKVVDKVHHDMKNENDGMVKTSIPTTDNEFRRYIEGKVAILNNVPIPKVNMLENGDCYVLPSDFLQLYFALGVMTPHMIKSEKDIPDNGDNVQSIWETKKARECLNNLDPKDNETYKILLHEWSDGFDPGGSNKNNRGSIHITSFSLLAQKNSNDPRLTFPSTISSDKSDHIEIRRIVYEDLYKLRQKTKFYNGKEFINVQVIYFNTNQDRPERSKSTGHGYHNAAYSSRFGWISKYDDMLLPCGKCHTRRCKNNATSSASKCRDCYDWDYSRISIKLPPEYPLKKKLTATKLHLRV